MRRDSFSKILDMQLPEIIPFENTELEMKFQEVSGQIILKSSRGRGSHLPHLIYFILSIKSSGNSI